MPFILFNAAVLLTLRRRVVGMCRSEGTSIQRERELEPTRLHSLNRAFL